MKSVFFRYHLFFLLFLPVLFVFSSPSNVSATCVGVSTSCVAGFSSGSSNTYISPVWGEYCLVYGFCNELVIYGYDNVTGSTCLAFDGPNVYSYSYIGSCSGSPGEGEPGGDPGSGGTADGSCGQASGPIFSSSQPDPSNLCYSGSASVVTGGGGGAPWTWSCYGTGGSTVSPSCSAPSRSLSISATPAVRVSSQNTAYTFNIAVNSNAPSYNSILTSVANSPAGGDFTYIDNSPCAGGPGNCGHNYGTSVNPQYVLGTDAAFGGRGILTLRYNGTGYPTAGSYSLTFNAHSASFNDNAASTVTLLIPGPPNNPTVSGPTTGVQNTSYTYTLTSTDAQGDQIRYGVDWDMDGTADQWVPSSGYVNSGVSQTVSHSWSSNGNKTFQVLAQDTGGSGYSALNSGWTSWSTNLSAAVTLTASPQTGTSPLSTTLTWTVTGSPASCTATGGTFAGSKSVSGGSQVVSNIITTTTYTLQCDTSNIASVTVTPTVSIPTVTLSAFPSSGISPLTTTLTWTTTNTPTSCTGAGGSAGWPGAKNKGATNNQVITGLTAGTYNFSITCANSAGTSALSVARVTVTNPAVTYNVHVNKTYGGSVQGGSPSDPNSISCGSNCGHDYAQSSVVTLVPTPDSAQWRFIGWTGSCTGNGSCILNIDSNKDVTALFALRPLLYQEF